MSWESIFGQLGWDSLVFTGAIKHPSASEFVAFGAGSIVVLGAIAVVVLLTAMRWWGAALARLADQCRSQKNRHHVHRDRPRHVLESSDRSRCDALAATGRLRQCRLPVG